MLNTADYGIPQVRKRLITILGRTDQAKKHFDKVGTFSPKSTQLINNKTYYRGYTKRCHRQFTKIRCC